MESVENLLAKRFIARPDVKAVQQDNGAWHPDVAHTHHYSAPCPGSCERRKFTRQDLEDHVSGKRTYGHYLLSTDSKCKFFCYDLDLKTEGVWVDDLGTWHEFNPREAWLDPEHPSKSWQTIQLRCLAEGLALRVKRELGMGIAVSYSGSKGLHVYGFAEQAEPAADIRRAAIHILESFGCFKRVRGEHFWEHEAQEPMTGYPNIGIEVFPKQDSLEDKDLGNLLRLPLGIHKKSGQQAFFLNLQTGYNQLVACDPQVLLTTLDPWADA